MGLAFDVDLERFVFVIFEAEEARHLGARAEVPRVFNPVARPLDIGLLSDAPQVRADAPDPVGIRAAAGAHVTVDAAAIPENVAAFVQSRGFGNVYDALMAL